MRTGRVTIDFAKLAKKYPYFTVHLMETLADKEDVYYEVNKENNPFYEPDEGEVRIVVHYKEKDGKANEFTVLITEEYITYIEEEQPK